MQTDTMTRSKFPIGGKAAEKEPDLQEDCEHHSQGCKYGGYMSKGLID